MPKYDVTVSVYDVNELQLVSVRNAVIKAIPANIDISIMVEEKSETDEVKTVLDLGDGI